MPLKDKHVKNSMKRTVHAQSAMEYLMTYGWAILIIAIVLGVMFQLGIFGAANILGTSCLASPGFLCNTPTLTSSSSLTFTLGQNTGATMYNIQLACAASELSTGLPSPSTAFNSISSSGVALPASSTGNSLVSGGTITVSALPCYSSTGQAAKLNVGYGYSGYVWMNYTPGSGPESPANVWRTLKVITLKISVT